MISHVHAYVRSYVLFVTSKQLIPLNPSFLFALLPVRLKCKGLGGSVSGSCVCARATSDMNPEVKPGNKKGMRPGPWKLHVRKPFSFSLM